MDVTFTLSYNHLRKIITCLTLARFESEELCQNDDRSFYLFNFPKPSAESVLFLFVCYHFVYTYFHLYQMKHSAGKDFPQERMKSLQTTSSPTRSSTSTMPYVIKSIWQRTGKVASRQSGLSAVSANNTGSVVHYFCQLSLTHTHCHLHQNLLNYLCSQWHYSGAVVPIPLKSNYKFSAKFHNSLTSIFKTIYCVIIGLIIKCTNERITMIVR